MKHNFDIPKFRLGELTAKLKRISTRARKLHVKPPIYNIGKAFVKKVKIQVPADPYGHSGINKKVKIEFVSVTVEWTAEIIAEGGRWRVIGTIEKASGDLNFIDTKPDNEVDLKQFRTHDMSCEHCAKKRQRKSVVILHDADADELKIVGRQCLSDFLGYDVQLICDSLSIYDSILRAMNGFDEKYDDEDIPRGERLLSIEKTVVMAFAVIRDCGGVYYNAQSDCPTSGQVAEQIFFDLKDDEVVCPEDCDKELAEEFLSEYREMDPAEIDNDFVYKVALLVQDEAMKSERLGLLCGAVGGWLKRRKMLAERKTAPKSEYFGEEGERDDFEVEVDRVHTTTNDYGLLTIISGVQAGTDNRFVWFASDIPDTPLIRNDNGVTLPTTGVHKIRATVKRHDESQYGKQTIINRVEVKA